LELSVTAHGDQDSIAGHFCRISGDLLVVPISIFGHGAFAPDPAIEFAPGHVAEQTFIVSRIHVLVKPVFS
jgi:hypothetical protein